jgi:hypothetical protein
VNFHSKIILLSVFWTAAAFADSPACVIYFKSLVRMWSLSSHGGTTEISSRVRITELTESMWNDLAAEIQVQDVARDPRIILRDPEGNTVAFGKFASSKIEIGYFYPLIENGPSGKREVVYHALDKELGTGLTGRTVSAKLPSGERISVAEFHSDAIEGWDARNEINRADEAQRLRDLLKKHPDTFGPELTLSIEKAIAATEADLIANGAQETRIQKVPPGSFQKMGLMDIVLGQTDRNTGNWMVTKDGKLKAIDNARILGISMKFKKLDTYKSELLSPEILGQIDAETKAQFLALTPLKLDELLKFHKIPAVYRHFARKNLEMVQARLRENKTFEQILEDASARTVNDFIPLAIVTSVAAAGAGVTYYGLKPEN